MAQHGPGLLVVAIGFGCTVSHINQSNDIGGGFYPTRGGPGHPCCHRRRHFYRTLITKPAVHATSGCSITADNNSVHDPAPGAYSSGNEANGWWSLLA